MPRVPAMSGQGALFGPRTEVEAADRREGVASRCGLCPPDRHETLLTYSFVRDDAGRDGRAWAARREGILGGAADEGGGWVDEV